MSRPVVVLRALGLGDALTAVPALRGVRRLYSGRPLLLAGKEPVSAWLCRLGLADEVVRTDGLSGQPPGRSIGRHVAVNLHGRGPQSHQLLQAGRPDELIAFDCADAGHRSTSTWRSDEHEVRRWCRLLNDAGGASSAEDLRLPVATTSDGAVVVHPGAGSVARQWPVRRWTEVIRELGGDGQRVVLTGSEIELCASLAAATGAEDLSGKLSLDGLADRVAGASLVLCGDTGISHLATAVGTRSVTLFGPTPPAWWGPAIDHELHIVLYHGSDPGDPHAGQPDRDLLRISVREVLDAARQQLVNGTRRPSLRVPPANRPEVSS